jgi:hypothetical protein
VVRLEAARASFSGEFTGAEDQELVDFSRRQVHRVRRSYSMIVANRGVNFATPCGVPSSLSGVSVQLATAGGGTRVGNAIRALTAAASYCISRRLPSIFLAYSNGTLFALGGIGRC